MNETDKDKELKDSKTLISVKVQKLTSALYLVTSFFSDSDPLKWKLRDRALEVLSQTNEASLFDASINSIGQLLSLIEVTLIVPGISQMNFSLLKKEYEEVRQKMLGVVPEALPWESESKGEASGFLLPRSAAGKVSPWESGAKGNTLPARTKPVNNPRREIILKFVKNHGWSSIKDIAQTMPEVSVKTVQRELAEMVQSRVLKKEGDRRWSRYELAAR
jgi:hypothetical protein